MGRSVGGAVSAVGFGLVADATSLLPPRWRYAYVHPLTRKTLHRKVVRFAPSALREADTLAHVAAATRGEVTCALVADKLDVGGIGSVVETLVSGLPSVGVTPIVICQGDGARAQRLRARGVEVVSVPDGTTLTRAVAEANADVVQLHSAPPWLERSALDAGTPLVTVLHNTEIHYTRAQWRRFAALAARSAAIVPVSRVVRDFHLRRLPAGTDERFEIIPNGAAPGAQTDAAARRTARDLLSTALGVDLADDVVFVCLARYDAQKNIAGMVRAFARAAQRSETPMRLVVAGEPSDWVEFRRADGIRRMSRGGERVHLLGNSDARALLAAGDAFLLDSFFEGWPVAATEAAACGLPLLLSDVGGAEELVARDPLRSRLVANATGAADAVTDARVGRARARSLRQANTAALVDALTGMAAEIETSRAATREASVGAEAGGIDEMLRAHGALLRRVARSHAITT